MKLKYGIFAALLVMVALLVLVPAVSATVTEVSNYQITGTSWYRNMYSSIITINKTAFQDVSRLESNLGCWVNDAGALYDGQQEVGFYSGTKIYGNATRTWKSTRNLATWPWGGNLNIVFSNFTHLNTQGETGLTDIDIQANSGQTFPTTAQLSCLYGGSQNPDSLQYGYRFKTADATKINGTYKTYIGQVDVLTYPNVTINIKSNATGLNIPRAYVELYSSPGWVMSGYTNLEGNFTPAMVIPFNTNVPPYFMVSKAGYVTRNVSPGWNVSQSTLYYSAALNDVTSPPGGRATVYLDVADLKTGLPIGGATVGIQNTTAAIDSWRYNTYQESTIAFNTTNINPEINLSVGQVVEFSGYRSGMYVANHTGTFTIPSVVSHVSLLLDKVEGNESAAIQYPVTITDSITGNAIANSWLHVDGSADFTGWHNMTSASGKFNVTGKGTSGTLPLAYGDILTFQGNATGYKTGGYAITVTAANNGITQYVSLMPVSYSPVSGEFTAQVSAYEEGSTDALSNVELTVKTGSNSTSKITNTIGAATFKNLTAGDSYSLTAKKTGYTSITKTFSGGSGQTVYIDVAMSPVGVNPPHTTTTTTPGGSGNSSAANEKASNGILGFLDFMLSIGGLVCVFLFLKFLRRANK
jgi:hypothetical protein